MLSRSTSNQAMRRSKSFRALVLFGVVVALVTAFYQSITLPSSVPTITTGLTPRHSVFKPELFPLILMRLLALLHEPPLLCGPRPFGPGSLCMHTPSGHDRSYSSGTAEVLATKTVSSWSNALGAPDEDQYALLDVGAPRYDQCGPLDAPNDNQCAPNEPVIASPEASATVRVGITRTIPLSAHLECAPCSANSCRALFLIAHA